MCGLIGLYNPRGFDHSIPTLRLLGTMADSLAHRGPDDSGTWLESACGVAFGHRRLSILDLSPEGHQPMVSASGRFVIIFNGEIYNFSKLRSELDNSSNHPIWRGHSDTEIILAGFEQWGIRETINSLVGMFAMAIFDRIERKLFIFRDRMGEKPLYYGFVGADFVFASELKPFRLHPSWSENIDRSALALLLRYNSIPAPWSIYRGIKKLKPGHFLEISPETFNRKPIETPYWSLSEIALRGFAQPFAGSEEDALNWLEILLRDAIRQQMVADVPLGAFLSGGIDSSVIVALMQAQSMQPVRTFTIGFHDPVFNEAVHARKVAEHLKTRHTEWYVTPRDALNVIPRLPAIFDEPFSDSSQIPTFLVASLTRKHVTVSLSGDAGDELFGGYNRYFSGASLWKMISGIPAALREHGADLIDARSPAFWNKAERLSRRLFGKRFPVAGFANQLPKLAGILRVSNSHEMYQFLLSHWLKPSEIVIDGPEPALPHPMNPDMFREGHEGFAPFMMLSDGLRYLPDDILVKVDRTAMAVSLETRVPFLDHRIIEFAWRLPMAMKIRDGRGKHLLRKLAYKYIPPELIDRPKWGFGIPLGEWLRGPLKEWAGDLLDEGKLRRDGFFRPEPILKAWNDHVTGITNNQYHLWDILMFQSWYNHTHAAVTHSHPGEF